MERAVKEPPKQETKSLGPVMMGMAVSVWIAAKEVARMKSDKDLPPKSKAMDRSDIAFLGNEKGYSIFEFRGRRIRFTAPYSLERYARVKKWDDGYIVVDAKYSHNTHVEEEYIDLTPILQDLYIDPSSFLKPIKAVEVARA